MHRRVTVFQARTLLATPHVTVEMTRRVPTTVEFQCPLGRDDCVTRCRYTPGRTVHTPRSTTWVYAPKLAHILDAMRHGGPPACYKERELYATEEKKSRQLELGEALERILGAVGSNNETREGGLMHIKPKQLEGGEWGITGDGPTAPPVGAVVTVTKRSGETSTAKVTGIVSKGPKYWVASAEKAEGQATWPPSPAPALGPLTLTADTVWLIGWAVAVMGQQDSETAEKYASELEAKWRHRTAAVIPAEEKDPF